MSTQSMGHRGVAPTGSGGRSGSKIPFDVSISSSPRGTRAPPPALASGQRVRLRPPLLEVELRSRLGTVLREGDYAGYYVIRLDEPARYFPLGPADQSESEEIIELVESSDNVDVWLDGEWREPAWARSRSRARINPGARPGPPSAS